MAIAESVNTHKGSPLKTWAAIAKGRASNKIDKGRRSIDARMFFTPMLFLGH